MTSRIARTGLLPAVIVAAGAYYYLHACLLLKNTGFDAIALDLAYLTGFAVVAMALATRLFRRTL